MISGKREIVNYNLHLLIFDILILTFYLMCMFYFKLNINTKVTFQLIKNFKKFLYI